MTAKQNHSSFQAVTVVGGSGFIGSCFCVRLQKAERAFTIVDKATSSRFSSATCIADVRSLDSLQAALPTGKPIVHLAAEHRDDVRPRTLYDEVNVGGTRNLCLAARELGIKTIVFTSSVAVYGFAPLGTDESGAIAPFNDYGRTKYLAEEILREWQAEDPANRSLTIVRPTVVFGERNRGNVFNLLKQIGSGRFMMVGNGANRKSMAYVENVAAFLEFALDFGPGTHLFNYIDKPDFTMNDLVSTVRSMLGQAGDGAPRLRLPYWAGLGIGLSFDALSRLSGRKFPISAIRVKKFCADSVYATAIDRTGFAAPVHLDVALRQTVRNEFVDAQTSEQVFYTE